ncbi:MAG: serine/threonine-protein kinase [Pirellulaceae bacterium]|nr:serine/threonine-protein kinase [Pirellulaceae bacterium]
MTKHESLDNEDDLRTVLPTEVGQNIEGQSAPRTESQNEDNTFRGSWFGLLSKYNHLLAQPEVRQEDIVSIEDYARQNGLWLMLDSISQDVVEAEIRLRQSAGQEVRRSDYSSRFPHLSRQLSNVDFESSSAHSPVTEGQAGDNTVSTVLTQNEANADSSPPQSLSIGSLFGQYRIDREIGHGGMGAVYLATHVKLSKQVALKILPKAFSKDRDRVLRFEREMRSLGRVDHPNIVRAFDAGDINGIQYLAMEYVEGIDLQKMIKKMGTCTPQLACSLLAQTTAGLHVAHSAGLVHRDIKPSNILVTHDGTVKIVDLGLARIQTTDTETDATDGLTLQQQMMGTPDYMAPEQWANAAEADGRADLYALGCTLYFLISGQPPFGTSDTKTVSRKMKAHLSSPAPSLLAIRDDLPEGLVELYTRLMAKDPEKRPQSALEVTDALNQIYPQVDTLKDMRSFVDMKQLHRSIAEASDGNRPSSPWIKSWGVAAGAIGLLIGIGSMFLTNSRPKTVVTNDRTVSVQSTNTSIAVEVIQKRSETDLQRRGYIGQQIDSAKLGDLVKLSIQFAKPRYCYVIALNPTEDLDWNVQLLHPASSDAKPESIDSLTIPSRGTSFIPLTDGSGQQVYLVVESSKSLPSFSEWNRLRNLSSLWTKCQRSGVWQFVDGSLSLRPLPDQERAAIVDIAPPELSNTLDKLQASIEGEQQQMTAVAFPVQAPFTR